MAAPPGNVTVAPATVVAGSTGNELVFRYRAPSHAVIGLIAITIPTGWTPPQTQNASAPGYVRAQRETCVVAGIVPIPDGSATIKAGLLCAAAQTFSIHYSNATAPFALGRYGFTTLGWLNLMPGFAPFASQPTVAVQAGAADHLVFRVQPSSATAGASIAPAPAVQIVDAAGNPTASAANVTLAIGANPGAATLSGTTTAAAVDGLATFPRVSLDRAANGYTLLASSPGLTSATSGPFAVTPAPAANIALVLNPDTIDADGVSTSAATATVTDAFGNRRAGDAVSFSASGDVTVGAVADGGDGTYAATLTASTSAGDETITARDGALTATTVLHERSTGPGSQSNPGLSCRAILVEGGSGGDGVYWLRQAGGEAYQAYCDMTSDGGGWTAVFAGRNGSPNVFDHFDVGSYVGTFTDPATRYLRRAPAGLPGSELAVSCGGAMVKFALSEPARGWMVSGVQSGWVTLTPTVVQGSVANVPNTLWTGVAGNASFIFASNQGGGGNTFASSSGGSAVFDSCNGVADTSSLVRVFYREAAPTPVRNTLGTAGTSCRAMLAGGASGGDGIYWLQQPGGDPYQAYCDMTTDGGGWTAVFAGRNGSPNVFDHFDAGSYVGTFTDPATRYLRRAPAALTTGELAVSCGDAMVKFALTEPARGWMVSGVQSAWTTLTPTVVQGTVANVPNTLWTGDASNASFIFARDQSGLATFASSYSGSAAFNFCNGLADTSSLLRVFYRESP